jgi:two-component system response regulator PilR (NtrC family)
VRPVGAEQEVRVDVRILSATHKHLGAEVDEGRFRSDLFYRINVIELRVPSLRERVADIRLLAAFCVRRLSQEYGLAPPRIADEALAALEKYRFPGNVRELENILERAFTLCEGAVIREADLRLPELPEEVPDPTEGLPTEYDAEAGVPLEKFLEDIERKALIRALDLERWNRTAAAKRLGMSFRSIRYRLKKLGID